MPGLSVPENDSEKARAGLKAATGTLAAAVPILKVGEDITILGRIAGQKGLSVTDLPCVKRKILRLQKRFQPEIDIGLPKESKVDSEAAADDQESRIGCARKRHVELRTLTVKGAKLSR